MEPILITILLSIAITLIHIAVSMHSMCYAIKWDVEQCLTAIHYDLKKLALFTESIDNSLGELTEEPTKLATLLLKDTFLSRKDREEGIMLIEAVEKQLSRKPRKSPNPAKTNE